MSRCSEGGTDPVTVEAEGNLGLGFWTHQLRGAVSWYPWENRGTAFVGALTDEMNGNLGATYTFAHLSEAPLTSNA